jgi:phosphopantothenate synthetase
MEGLMEVRQEFDSMKVWFQDVIVATPLDKERAAALKRLAERIIDSAYDDLERANGKLDVAAINKVFCRMRGSLYTSTEMTLLDNMQLQEQMKRQVRTVTSAIWHRLVVQIIKRGSADA